jgi:hypothetical protein
MQKLECEKIGQVGQMQTYFKIHTCILTSFRDKEIARSSLLNICDPKEFRIMDFRKLFK